MCYTGICQWEALDHNGDCFCTKPAKDLCFSEVMSDTKYHDHVYDLLNEVNQAMQLYLYHRANGDQNRADDFLAMARNKLAEII